MATPPRKVNMRSTAVKRIMQEAAELEDADHEDDGFVAAPLEEDMFEWHCTMRGVQDSEYDGGLYHLRIILPPSYPFSAPDIMLLTPSGRFELGKKICIDGLTSFHAGSWQPAWGVRTALVGLRSFWMQDGEALSAIGALSCSPEERRRLAKASKDWRCPTCGVRNEELISVRAAETGGKGKEKTGEGSGGVDEHGGGAEKETGSGEAEVAGEESVKEEQPAPAIPAISLAPPDDAPTIAPPPLNNAQPIPIDPHFPAVPALAPAPAEASPPDALPSGSAPTAPAQPPPTTTSPHLEPTPTPTVPPSAVAARPATSNPAPLTPPWLDHLIALCAVLLGVVLCHRVFSLATPDNISI
ncbi:hypothetical protein IAT38_004432 [Cryptococcus sp. DSM 104549]